MSNTITFTPTNKNDLTTWVITIEGNIQQDHIKKLAEPIMEAYAKERIAYYNYMAIKDTPRWFQVKLLVIVLFVFFMGLGIFFANFFNNQTIENKVLNELENIQINIEKIKPINADHAIN
ncbi:MAG: hypothetical protein WA099_08030 [Sulfuricurvum sp.]